MSEPAPPYLCPKCQGPMQVGFLLDYAEQNVPFQQTWITGEPDRGWAGDVVCGGQLSSGQAIVFAHVFLVVVACKRITPLVEIAFAEHAVEVTEQECAAGHPPLFDGRYRIASIGDQFVTGHIVVDRPREKNSDVRAAVLRRRVFRKITIRMPFCFVVHHCRGARRYLPSGSFPIVRMRFEEDLRVGDFFHSNGRRRPRPYARSAHRTVIRVECSHLEGQRTSAPFYWPLDGPALRR